MSSNCSEISLKTFLNRRHPRRTLLLSTQVTFCGVPMRDSRLLASSNANLMTRSLPAREIGLGSQDTSPSRPGKLSI